MPADRDDAACIGPRGSSTASGRSPAPSQVLAYLSRDTHRVSDAGPGAIALIYSITSSARPRSSSGTAMPSAFAVLRLMTNSNLVTSCTGKSAAFSPLRIRPT
jgi:hypothetical protein